MENKNETGLPCRFLPICLWVRLVFMIFVSSQAPSTPPGRRPTDDSVHSEHRAAGTHTLSQAAASVIDGIKRMVCWPLVVSKHAPGGHCQAPMYVETNK